jgi:hypothetical protein
LSCPGVLWRLAFVSWVLLQPERINAYAQAVIRTLQADQHQRRCLAEERVLKGDLMYEKSGIEVFKIKDPRHAEYWVAQAFTEVLVIRNSECEVRWMEVRDYLKRVSENGTKPVKQIVFEGERFDVMSVRRWREKMLAAAQ